MAAILAAPLSTDIPTPRRWTVAEFDRLPDGFFGDERVELIDGLIYTKMGQGLAHITALRYVFRAVALAYRDGFNVSMQIPIALSDGTKLEPDALVLLGEADNYDMRYPDPATEIALLVEVSETSLAYDLGPKLSRYAASGVPEYWILDLPSRALQVCRGPQGETYTDTAVFREGERVTVNGVEIEIAALLPKSSPSA